MISQLDTETARRRTFAIISHPDAGKTTLTEKLLLYANAIDLAGAVKAKKNQRSATSDWMELERQRGISISSTVLQFDYLGYRVNLLDTPGHQDFSEDTYRTLTAADSAVMLMDSAKGLEVQTRKLFAVCSRRKLPIFTFYNKMDRPAREPLELLGEIEDVLSISAYAMNWPLGVGETFRGVYDRTSGLVHRFEHTEHGGYMAPVQTSGIEDPILRTLVDKQEYTRFREEIELLDLAGGELDAIRFAQGEITPVYFGSARTNFGVEPFFRSFLAKAPSPADAVQHFIHSGNVHSNGSLAPASRDTQAEEFGGFVFKIQANMDPNHRDCVAFMRVVTGHFERDMQVMHLRTRKRIRLSRAMKLFAQDRISVDEAWPGDIVGLINPGLFAIGDTLSSGGELNIETVPRFPAEHFAFMRVPDTSKRKSFMKGLDQLRQEGAIQVLYGMNDAREPILAVVGQLQIEVAAWRLRAEYGVETVVERLAYTCARWVVGDADDMKGLFRLSAIRATVDLDDRPVALFEGEWSLRYAREKYPNLRFDETPTSD